MHLEKCLMEARVLLNHVSTHHSLMLKHYLDPRILAKWCIQYDMKDRIGRYQALICEDAFIYIENNPDFTF